MTTQPLPKAIRVRMAPSPTGSLHIGGVRTALYNVLFARQHSATAILRIEDTDAQRSTKAFEQDILDSFTWAGVEFDEGVMPDGSEKGSWGPYRQTARTEIYAKYLQQLLSENKAYYCFCTKEDLEAQRQSQESAGQVAKYSGKCRSYTEFDMAKNLAEGKDSVIRFKLPQKKVKLHDMVRGTVEFDNNLSGDIVIAKSMSEPLYNFAVVVDDHEMQISHVIRGEEHLANTPKQIALAEALGFAIPKYAHLPLILSATGKGKMSKRDGGTTVREYQDAGYLPQALINFLVLIGWHPVGDKEILTFDEMVKEFSLERVQKGGAAFDKNKLDFFNAHYIKQSSVSQLVAWLADDRFSDPAWRMDSAFFEKVVAVSQDRLTTLADFRKLAEPIFSLPAYDAKLLVWKKGTAEGAKENLCRVRELLSGLPEQLFTKESLEPKVMELAEKYGRGDVLWPLRVALSGQDASPPPIDLLVVFGKVQALERIDTAINKITG